MTELTPLLSQCGSAAKIRPSTMFTTSRITHARTSVPNTCQPWPRTSSRLRPNEASAPDRSMMMTGTITAQMVIRNRPGTMSSSSPIVIAMPARIEAPATDAINGRASFTV